jgi:endonuclease YncB( thermonuclease family)
VPDGGDINAAIVRRGWAVDWPRYSSGAYSREQEAAKSEKTRHLVRSV